MKLKLLVVLTMFIGAAAMAEGHEPAQMNFNAMIDANDAADTGLNQDLSDHYAQKDKDAKAPKEDAIEEKAVDDFITFEVHRVKKSKVAAEERPQAKLN